MPFPKLDKYDQVIAELAADYDRASDVWRRFQKMAAERSWHDIPAERTVKRRVADFQRLPPAQRRHWGRFHWPESMIEGLLPWDVARESLDLLQYRSSLGLERPTVAEVQWYWRIVVAAPSIDTAGASELAADLAMREFVVQLANREGEGLGAEHIEWLLAYQPWADREARACYEAALAREVRPIVGLAPEPEPEPGLEQRMRPPGAIEGMLDKLRTDWAHRSTGKDQNDG